MDACVIVASTAFMITVMFDTRPLVFRARVLSMCFNAGRAGGGGGHIMHVHTGK